MEEYIVSARKYRPLNFDSVVGQHALTTTLKNAISSGKLAHAYLFCGPRGVGKTTCARIFAKSINCLSPLPNGDACGQCESCRAFDEQRSMSIHELDAASNNSVEDIRELCKQVLIPPQVGKYKVFIIDEVHMLSPAAFNAFLKTLEEPPSYVIFILATTEKHRILPTILSRCQVYDFQRMSTQDTIDHLHRVAEKEGYEAEPEALNLIAQKADGGMRDALSIFDQMVSFTGGRLTYQNVCQSLNVLSTEYYFKLVDFFLSAEVTPCLLLLNEILQKGFDGGNFVAGLATHLRNLLVARDQSTLKLLEMSEQMQKKYSEQALRCKPRFLYRAIKLCNDCDLSYKTSNNKRLQLEICLIQAAQLNEEESPGAGLGPAKTLNPIFNVQGTQSQPAPVQPATASTSTTQSSRQYSSAVPTAAPEPSFRYSSQTGTPQSGQPTTATAPLQANPAEAHNQPVNTQPPVPQTLETHVTMPYIAQSPHTTPASESRTSLQTSGTLRKVSFRHIGTKPKANTPEESTPPVTSIPDKPLQLEEIRVAWQKYVRMMPDSQTAMAQRMKSMQPAIEGGDSIVVTVGNPQVRDALEAMRPSMEQFMKKELSNIQVTLQFQLMEMKQQAAYDKTDHMRTVIKRNHVIDQLISGLELELG